MADLSQANRRNGYDRALSHIALQSTCRQPTTLKRLMTPCHDSQGSACVPPCIWSQTISSNASRLCGRNFLTDDGGRETARVDARPPDARVPRIAARVPRIAARVPRIAARVDARPPRLCVKNISHFPFPCSLFPVPYSLIFIPAISPWLSRGWPV